MIKRDIFLNKFLNSKLNIIILLVGVLIYNFERNRILNTPKWLTILLILLTFSTILIFLFFRYRKFKEYYKSRFKDKFYVSGFVLGILIFTLICQSFFWIPLNYYIKFKSKNNEQMEFRSEITNVFTTGYNRIDYSFKREIYSAYLDLTLYDKKELTDKYYLLIKAKKSIFGIYYVNSFEINNKKQSQNKSLNNDSIIPSSLINEKDDNKNKIKNSDFEIENCERLYDEENSFNQYPDIVEVRILDSLINLENDSNTKFFKQEKKDICKYDTIVNWILQKGDYTYFGVYLMKHKTKEYILAISKDMSGTGIGSNFRYILLLDLVSGKTFETATLSKTNKLFFFDKRDSLFYFKINYSADWDKDWDNVKLEITKNKVIFGSKDILLGHPYIENRK
jgi:hypothetical protein